MTVFVDVACMSVMSLLMIYMVMISSKQDVSLNDVCPPESVCQDLAAYVPTSRLPGGEGQTPHRRSLEWFRQLAQRVGRVLTRHAPHEGAAIALPASHRQTCASARLRCYTRTTR